MMVLLKYLLIWSWIIPQVALAKISIVTTIKPLHSLISAVVDNVVERDIKGRIEKKVDVKLLLNAKSSPHHYLLKPSDIKSLEQADIIFFIDRNLENFIPKYMDIESQLPQEVIEISQASGVILLPIDKQSIYKKAPFSSQVDPHLWLSPENGKRIVQIIADVMCEFDAENADLYQSNANIYINHIKSIDNKIHYLMDEIKDKPFVVYHDAYQYFIKHYGLNQKAALTIEDQHLPGAATLNKFNKLILKENIKHVFGEARESNKFLKSILNKHVKICYLDAEWGINEAQRHKSDYEAYLIMLQNIGDNIYSCLKSSITNTVPNR